MKDYKIEVEHSKFTQEVKDKWIQTLESGDFIQTNGSLTHESKHCCIGVLGEIHNQLTNQNGREKLKCPYEVLECNIGKDLTDDLWRLNDNTFDKDNPNYENVIPFIKKLEVWS